MSRITKTFNTSCDFKLTKIPWKCKQLNIRIIEAKMSWGVRHAYRITSVPSSLLQLSIYFLTSWGWNSFSFVGKKPTWPPIEGPVGWLSLLPMLSTLRCHQHSGIATDTQFLISPAKENYKISQLIWPFKRSKRSNFLHNFNWLSKKHA